MNTTFHLALLLASLVLWSSPALAFGREGHEIVAHIAYAHLTPAARIKLNHLLSDNTGLVGPELMVEAAFWTDEIKKHPGTPVSIFIDYKVRNAAGTHPFHFADMAGDTYNPATDSDRGRSVVSGVERCTQVLKTANASPGDKREALKFLIHFVGDAHQPLHAGRKTDKGGNNILIAAFLNRHPTKGFNLHEVWDTLLIQSVDRDPARYAARLDSRFAGKPIPQDWTVLKPATWIEESHLLAKKNAYVDETGRPIVSGQSLAYGYVKPNVAVIETQLMKAGVRLALMLNELVGR